MTTAAELAELPRTVPEYLAARLGAAVAATRALVWDPQRLLGGAQSVEDGRGRQWQVIPFDGDRIALLRAWRKRRGGERTLIVAAPPPWQPARVLDLSYLPAIAAELELFFDLRLGRVLADCAPDQGWSEAALSPVSGLVAGAIGPTIRAVRELQALRRLSGVSRPLVRAAALAAVLPGEPPAAYLPAPGRGAWPVLFDYVRRATDPRTPELARSQLLAIARAEVVPNSPLAGVLELPPGELAAALLVIALTASALADVASRALDAVFGPGREPIAALHGLRKELLEGLSAQPAFVGMLDERAVLFLPGDTLARSVLGADSRPPGEIAALLGSLPARAAEALATAAVLRFGTYALDSLLRELGDGATAPGSLLAAAPPAAGALVAALRALGDLVRAAEEQPPAGGLQTLAEGWSASTLCRAETRLSELRERLLPLAPEAVRHVLESYTIELRRRIRDRIEAWDARLAALLAEPGGVDTYHAAPCALAFAQRDLQARPGGDSAAVFLVVIDGMRLDTWQEIVRPILERAFAVQRSECRLVTLPSYTVISRTAFFAAAQPDRWRGPTGAFTSQERELTALALGISSSERESALLYETQASAHPEDRPAAALRRRYNALVYNVCDDLVHEFQGSLWQLQSEIAHRVREQVLPDLQRRVRPGDTLLITSDHGFYGLDSADAVDVPPGSAEQASDVVKYRLIERPSTTEGLVVDWGPVGRFRLAQGRQWFRRAGGSPTPFSHGGLSWHEITVPVALLTLATAPVYRLVLQRHGAPPSAIEGQPVALPALVRNAGNRPLQVRLETRSVDFSVEPSSLTLAAGEQRRVVVDVVGQTRPGAYTAELFASYAAAATGDEAAAGEAHIALPFTVAPNPGRVELSSALDIFDDELSDLG